MPRLSHPQNGFGEHFFATVQRHSWKFYTCSRSAPLHTTRHILSYNRATEIERRKRTQNLSRTLYQSIFLLFDAVTTTIFFFFFLNVTLPTGRELRDSMAYTLHCLHPTANPTANYRTSNGRYRESQLRTNLTLRKANHPFFIILHCLTIIWQIPGILTFIHSAAERRMRAENVVYTRARTRSIPRYKTTTSVSYSCRIFTINLNTMP